MRGWVLLLLAAVFAMHGLQCAAADSGAPPGAHDAVVHAVAGADPVLHPVGTGATVAAAPDLPIAHVLSAAAAGSPEGSGHDSHPHGSGHLWAWCLAVLAAGLAALFLARIGRRAQLGLALPRRGAIRAWARLAAPRAPDLYSLCLMRI